MKVSFAAGLLALTALACSDDSSTAPELSRTSGRAAASGNQVVASVQGSAPLEVGGELRTFTFSAKLRADGTASGEFQLIARQVDRVTHGQITCLSVVGGSAWLGGIIDRDNSGVSTGAEARFRVVDLPQGPGGSPDLVSLLFFAQAPGFAQAFCNQQPPVAVQPTIGGEINVNQPGSRSFTSSTTIPVDLGVFVPCANDGAGELVVLSGSLHTLTHFTEDGAGGFHAMNEVNPQGISGQGTVTGDTYHGTGVTRSSFNAGPLPITQTFINNFRIIGPGPGNDLMIHSTFHMTINANGIMTAFVDNSSAECR